MVVIKKKLVTLGKIYHPLVVWWSPRKSLSHCGKLSARKFAIPSGVVVVQENLSSLCRGTVPRKFASRKFIIPCNVVVAKKIYYSSQHSCRQKIIIPLQRNCTKKSLLRWEKFITRNFIIPGKINNQRGRAAHNFFVQTCQENWLLSGKFIPPELLVTDHLETCCWRWV